jgi:hypothetical protein
MADAEDLASELAGLSHSGWLSRLDEIADQRGYSERLGKDHSAIFTDAGTVLLVTFETVEDIRSQDGQLPIGFQLADRHGWSQLCLMAERETWFRDPRVYAYFDRLVDDGFFEDFDRVIFYGAEMCGYAAAAFSVAAPGSTVILVQPQATLDPRVTGWDDRFRNRRRLAFNDRYGYAPEMIDGADHAYILFDPNETFDAIHAALFHRPHVTLIPCRNFGDQIGDDIRHIGLLESVLDRCAAGDLTPGDFYAALRSRKTYVPYLRGLVESLSDGRHPLRLALVTRQIAYHFKGRRFAKQADMAAKALIEKGIPMPRHRATGDGAAG